MASVNDIQCRWKCVIGISCILLKISCLQWSESIMKLSGSKERHIFTKTLVTKRSAHLLHTYIATIFWSLPRTCPLCPLSYSLQCQQYRESTSVLENQPAGTFVLQVHAVDADEGSNGRVTYGFMHKDSTVPAFSIHPDTGTETHTYSPSLAQTYKYRGVHILLFQWGFLCRFIL